MAFSMIFAADVVPTKSNVEAFCEGKMETIIDDGIFSYWKDADFRFLNLEVSLTDVETPIKKCGPALIAPTASVKGYKQLDPTLLGLCNNHILDQDEAGLADTIRTLEENGIAYTGVGENVKTAWKPYIYEKDGKKIGIYSCAEHEFTLATDTRAGANPFEPLDSLDHIADLKKECDYVIVVYHGGKEHYRYPSPRLKK
ncbi:MAG: CapA family protein, partial [Clostridia bacterium]|nr:CapA family protein [Clostridia bacterium]